MYGVYVEYTSCSGDSYDFIISSYDEKVRAEAVAQILNEQLKGHEGRFIVYPYQAPPHNENVEALLEEFRKPQASQEEILRQAITTQVDLTVHKKEVTLNHRDEVMLKTAEGYDFEASLKE